jgi:hypothetical protein
MKQTYNRVVVLCFHSFLMLSALFGCPAITAQDMTGQEDVQQSEFELNALPREPRILSYDPKVARQADIIFRKCLQKARKTKEKRLCESLKDAIHECLSSEMKRDEAKAQGICEKLFSIASDR